MLKKMKDTVQDIGYLIIAVAGFGFLSIVGLIHGIASIINGTD